MNLILIITYIVSILLYWILIRECTYKENDWGVSNVMDSLYAGTLMFIPIINTLLLLMFINALYSKPTKPLWKYIFKAKH